MDTYNNQQHRQLQFSKELPLDAVLLRQSYPQLETNLESADACLLITDIPLDRDSLVNFPSNLACIESSKATQFLGKELSVILFDARTAFDVNSFCAISGCLVAKGVIIVILPQYFDLDAPLKLSNYSGQACLNRLYKESQDYTTKHEPKSNIASVKAFPQSFPSSAALQQQQQVILQIKSCATGHAKRPLILSANRGRGKSASLGIACAELVYEKNNPILICTTRKSNLNIFFKHYYGRLQILSGDTITINQSLAEKFIEFIPPDQLAQSEPKHQLVIVEEAGSIPVQVLKQIANKSNRLIFSTTIDGYEGNGQGFEQRFVPFLNQLFRQVNDAQLTLPFRWCENDPLEKIINRAFLLSFSKHRVLQSSIEKTEKLSSTTHYRAVSQQQLNEDESLLKSIFKLLVTAHYQTRPSDLEALLSDPNWLVYTASFKNTLIAACVLCREGQLDLATSNAIEKGQKRLKGHLLAQSLMAYQGIEHAGQLSYWRIIRIAVTAKYRRQKIASRLVETIKQKATEKSVDILGSSFAMYPDVLEFWYHCNFSCMRIALKKESSTGSHPAEFLYSLKQQKNDAFPRSIKQFNRSFLHSLGYNYQHLDPVLIQIILDQQINHLATDIENQANRSKVPLAEPEHSNHYSLKEISRYTEKARSFEMVEWHLYYFVADCWQSGNITQLLTPWEKELLIYRLFQNQPWKLTAKKFTAELSREDCNPSKKIAQQGLRKIVSKLLSI